MRLFTCNAVIHNLGFLFAVCTGLFVTSPLTANALPSAVSPQATTMRSEPSASFLLGDETPASFFIGNIPKQFPGLLSSNEKIRTTLLDSRGLASKILHLSDMGDLYTITHVDRDDVAGLCGPLDCCDSSQCNLTFDAVFIRPNSQANSLKVKVTVHILDVNDNAPLFQTPSFHLTLPEATAADFSSSNGVWTHEHMHSLPQARDRDSVGNGVVRYLLTGDAVDAGLVSLSSPETACFPCLLLNKIIHLDYENPKHHNQTIQLTAVDGGEKPLSSTILIYIHLTDMNDNAPVFDKQSDTIVVQENKTYYQPIFIVRANDADSGRNAKLRYTISSPPQHSIGSLGKKFSLDSDTGELFIHYPLDYEKFGDRRVVLSIAASDDGRPSLSATFVLTVQVTDVNDNEPEIIVQQNNTVAENSNANSLALQMVIKDDDDVSQGRISCSIVSGKKVPLRLIAVAGETFLSIWTTESLDFEEAQFLNFELKCLDLAEPARNRTFPLTVKVGNKNDNAPVFYSSSKKPTTSYDLIVPEDEKTLRPILLPLVVDVDSEIITFSLEPVSGDYRERQFKQFNSFSLSHFTVKQETGAIYIKSPLDYESVKYYEFYLVARDVPDRESDDPVFSSRALVRVSVKDVNDNPPLLTSSSVIVVEENTSAASQISQVSFSDADDDGRQSISSQLLEQYSFPHYPQNESQLKNVFTLKENGALVTLKPLQNERASMFSLHILATDHGEIKQLTSTATIIVLLNRSVEEGIYLTHPFPGSTFFVKLGQLRAGSLQLPSIPLKFYDVRKTTQNKAVICELHKSCNASQYFEIETGENVLKFKSNQKLNELKPKTLFQVCLRLEAANNSNRFAFAEFMLEVERSPHLLGHALWPADSAEASIGSDVYPSGLHSGSLIAIFQNSSGNEDEGSQLKNSEAIFRFSLNNIVMFLLILVFSLAVGFALFAAILWARAKQATSAAAAAAAAQVRRNGSTNRTRGRSPCDENKSDGGQSAIWRSRGNVTHLQEIAPRADDDASKHATDIAMKTNYNATCDLRAVSPSSLDKRPLTDESSPVFASPSKLHLGLLASEPHTINWQNAHFVTGTNGGGELKSINSSAMVNTEMLPKLEGPIVAYFDLIVSTPTTSEADTKIVSKFSPSMDAQFSNTNDKSNGYNDNQNGQSPMNCYLVL